MVFHQQESADQQKVRININMSITLVEIVGVVIRSLGEIGVEVVLEEQRRGIS